MTSARCALLTAALVSTDFPRSARRRRTDRGDAAREIEKRVKERLLHHILRVGARTEDSDREARSAIAMPVDQGAEDAAKHKAPIEQPDDTMSPNRATPRAG
jgi:hypothetical protein